MIDIVSEIKNRLAIEEVARNYVQMRKNGRNYKALCPFHKEKTPSFVISPEKQLAYCFGCHKGGDIFKFVQEIENVDFPEALKILAEKAGVEMSKAMPFNVEKGDRDKKSVLYEINKTVAEFYQNKLWETKEGQKVIDYLFKRGLKESTIKEFSVGLAPDSYEETYRFLLDKNFTKNDLLAVGIASAKGIGTDQIFDRFRARLIFPITDIKGQIVGFGGRVLTKDDQPKYLNSPETVIYNKSLTLYGLDKAKSAIRDQDEVIVVEGYMDLIAAHQAGTKNAVASSGTALTEKQLNILKRLTKNMIFSFDTDTAGEEATLRAVSLAQPVDLNINIVRVINGKDPDECINSGIENWQESLKNRKFYLDYYLDRLKEKKFITPREKKEAINGFLMLLKQVPSKIELDDYVKKMANFFDLKVAVIYDEMKNLQKLNRISSNFTEEEKEEGRKTVYSIEEYLLGLIAAFPEHYFGLREQITEEIFTELYKPVYKVLNDYYNTHAVINPVEILEGLPALLKERFKFVIFWVQIKNEDLAPEFIKKEIEETICRLGKTNGARKRHDLIKAIKEAEKAGDDEKKNVLLRECANEILKLRDQKVN